MKIESLATLSARIKAARVATLSAQQSAISARGALAAQCAQFATSQAILNIAAARLANVTALARR
jgi:hypothetical protein